MRSLSKKIFLVLIAGVMLMYALVTFYKYEQNFSSERIAFSSSLKHIDKYNLDLKYNVLQSSLFAYHDQDMITKNIIKLKTAYKELQNQAILDRKNYAKIKKEISELEPIIDSKIDYINKYLILNAGIKNSFVYLSRHASFSRKYFKNSDSIHEQIYKLIESFSDARRIQDISYLNKDLRLLSDERTLNSEQKKYIKTFNLHSMYLINNFELFMNSVNRILDDEIDKKIDSIDQDFSAIAATDEEALNYFALSVLAILILSISTIIFLFVKISKENRLLQIAQHELDYALTHDKLTNLYNRYAFENIVSSKENSFTLLLINIDKFKQINDLYGNQIGNELLKELARLIQIKSLIDSEAEFFRLGGDEFAILSKNLSIKDAKETAKYLAYSIAAHHFIVSDISIHCSVSIAINNRYPLLENADMALKHIKSYPEIDHIVFDENMNLLEKIKTNIDTINLVKDALNGGRVVPYFQPILNIKRNKIEKYEALVRIINKDGSVMSPYTFLPIIKKTVLYKDITKIMINKVLDVAKNKPYRFSINLSMQDISNEDLMKMFFTQLEIHKSSDFNLDIELLETENLSDINKIQEFIEKAKLYGCQILIDDFGTGYSNFSYFSTLDIDILKIDGSITKEIMNDNKKFQILKAINRFSVAIEVQTVAEFVESKEILQMLSEVGINYAQGYYIGAPSPSLVDNDDFTLNPSC